MGFSVASPQGASTILAELSLAEAQAAQEVEGLTLPQELADVETLQQQALKQAEAQGTLRGESKQFVCVKEQGTYTSQKLADSLFDMNRPAHLKLADPKNALHHLSFKESAVKEKTFKTLEPHPQNLEGKSHQQTGAQTAARTLPQFQAYDKAHRAAQQALDKGQLPQSPARIRENSLKQQQSTSTKTLEQRVHKELDRKQGEPRKAAEGRELSRPSSERQAELHQQQQRTEKNPQREQRDEEEGFADGGQRQSQQESGEEGDHSSGTVRAIDATFSKQLAIYAAEESILSEIFKMRVSQFDVLILFIEIMKLDIKGREQQKLARRHERELQLMHMQKVVENFKDQGNWQLQSSLGAGVLGIISGILPIAGHMKGDWILEKLGGFFSSLRDMKKDQFFKNLHKITQSMSEMSRNTGQIQTSFAESHRTFDQHMSDLYRSDWDESTRTMEEIKDNWKGIENFLYQSLQMYHDSIRSLYS